MKFITSLFIALGLTMAAQANDVAVFKRVVTKTVTAAFETIAPPTGERSERFRQRETIYEVLDLTTEQYVIIETFDRDPVSGARVKEYRVSSVVDGQRYKRMPVKPSGELWYAAERNIEAGASDEDPGTDGIDDYFFSQATIADVQGRATPIRVTPGSSGKIITLPRRMTVQEDGAEQFQDDFEVVRGSKVFAGPGTVSFDAGLSRTANTPVNPDLTTATQVVVDFLEARGFTATLIP